MFDKAITEIHRLAHYLRADKHIFGTSDVINYKLIRFFTCPYAVGVICIGGSVVLVGVALKLPALPCKLLTAYCLRVFYGIIGDGCTAVLCKQIAPACVAVGVCHSRGRCAKGAGCKGVGLFTRYIARAVVSTLISFPIMSFS